MNASTVEHCNVCDVIKELSDALKGKDDALIAAKILEFYTKSIEPEISLCQRGIYSTKGTSDKIIAVRDKDYFTVTLYDEMEKRLKSYEECEGDLNYKQRRQKLEDIIRILQPNLNKKENKEPDIRLLLLLARTYLYRGMLFRPRGFTTPARKIEAIKKAKRLAEQSLQSDENDVTAWRTWAYSVLELKMMKDYDFEIPSEHLKKAGEHIQNDGISNLNDIAAILEYAVLSNNTSFLQNILDETRDWDRPYDLSLFKARAFFLLNNPKEVKEYTEEALEFAPDILSDPFWDSIVEFLKLLREKNCDIWKSLASAAYNLCCEKEKKISDSIYLRRYWARQKELYDLAFLAAKDEKKALIADSLKGRAMLRDQILLELNDKNIRKDFIELANEARDGRYLKRNPNIPRQVRKKISDQIGKNSVLPENLPDQIEKNSVLPENLPKPWIAIHFYLSDLELSEGKKQGYALIFDSDGKKWKVQPFPYQALYQKFLKWQEVYSVSVDDDEDIADLNKVVIELCREIGKAMPFLFDLPKERPVLWIPHGFLHRLPFHAAINPKNDEIFLKNHVSRYLPAWHILNTKSVKRNGEKRHVMLKNYSDYGFDNLKEDFEWDITDPATPEDFKEFAKKNPDTLIIICHGEGDILNPFKSCLKLKGNHLKISDILINKPEFSGTRVLLCACESDMAPPTEHTIDEHLSLSTVCLSHKATEVVAGLWKIDPWEAEICYIHLLENSNFAEKLKDWQSDRIKEGYPFYKVAPFRVMGFPEISEVLDKDENMTVSS